MAAWKLAVSDPTSVVLAFDRAPHHAGKRNLMYIDGSVELLSEAEFQECLEKDRKRMEKKPARPKRKVK